jgi:hypothetical protein
MVYIAFDASSIFQEKSIFALLAIARILASPTVVNFALLTFLLFSLHKVAFFTLVAADFSASLASLLFTFLASFISLDVTFSAVRTVALFIAAGAALRAADALEGVAVWVRPLFEAVFWARVAAFVF